ncbi:MAG: DUF1289 domain-containing protein [Methylobacteriaceae bacterium]|nr:DUF1289 domain-containing protein [Methylobacteriaceae bacterium]
MTVSTPCVQICVLDPRTRICTGCGRTVDEIARWSAMSEAERRAIMNTLPQRRVSKEIMPLAPLSRDRDRFR